MPKQHFVNLSICIFSIHLFLEKERGKGEPVIELSTMEGFLKIAISSLYYVLHCNCNVYISSVPSFKDMNL